MCLYRLSVTALAVTADDTRAFSVSKDGSIFQTDIEAGTRCAAGRPRTPEGVSVAQLTRKQVISCLGMAERMGAA